MSVHFPLILASASPRRAQLLRQYGFDFEILPSHAPEPGSFSASCAALENAFVKAQEVAKNHPDAFVLGADTVIELNNRIYGKPADLDDARRMLRTFSGQTHLVTTGVAILRESDHTGIRFAEISRVTFRTLTEETIRTYLERVPVLDKAGAYAVQESGELLIAAVSGDRDNVIGLPARTAESLRMLAN